MKLLLYRFSTTALGKAIIKLLSFGIRAPYLKKPRSAAKEHKKPFHVIITIDTEGGYVGKNERRVWQKEASHAYQGYYAGIRNIRPVLKTYGIEATFFLNTHCFSAQGDEHKKIMGELKALLKEDHEIGLHPHPDSDKALQKKLRKEFPATSCFFYDEKQLLKFIETSKELIGDHLGKSAEKSITSIRWGNWALNTEGTRAIISSGLKKDSSATPGIKGHGNDSRKYDWSNARHHYPWTLSPEYYQSTTTKHSPVTEVPIATFSFFGVKMRADPQYSEALKKAFSLYYAKTDRSQKPFPFVVMTHSSEATTKEGKPTRVLKDLDDFIRFAKKYPDVQFKTIKES